MPKNDKIKVFAALELDKLADDVMDDMEDKTYEIWGSLIK